MADSEDGTPTAGAALMQKAAELKASLQRKLKKACNKRFYDKKKLVNKLMYFFVRSIYASELTHTFRLGGLVTKTFPGSGCAPAQLFFMCVPARAGFFRTHIVFDRTGKRGPLPIPITPNTLLIHGIEALNRSLHTWGYRNKPKTEFIPFVLDALAEVLKSKDRQAALEAWATRQEEWIADGDRILNSIHLLLSEQIMDDAMIASPSMRKLWNNISDVVFTVTYMISAVEGRLDMLLYQSQWMVSDTGSGLDGGTSTSGNSGEEPESSADGNVVNNGGADAVIEV